MEEEEARRREEEEEGAPWKVEVVGEGQQQEVEAAQGLVEEEVQTQMEEEDQHQAVLGLGGRQECQEGLPWRVPRGRSR